MLKSRAQGGRWWTSWYGPEGINVPSWLSCFHPTNSHPLFGLPSAVRYPLPISLFKGTIWILHQVFSPPDYYLIPFYKNTTTKSLMHLLLFYHPFSSRKDVPTGPFWLKKQRHFIFGTLSRQWTLFMGILSHQTLGTGCYWWPSLEYFTAGVQITCPKVGFKFPSACYWSNFQMTSQPLRTNFSLVLSICFYPTPASIMI